MAQEDRFAPSGPPQGRGRASRAFASNAAANLLSQQQLDRRSTPQRDDVEDIFGGDTHLSDSSLGGTKSVLDRGHHARSYTEGQEEHVEPPIVGGGTVESPAAELDRMRAQEEQMRRTQEQFVGSPAASSEGGAEEQGRSRPASGQSVQAPTEEASPQETEPTDDEQREAEELNAQREAEQQLQQRRAAAVQDQTNAITAQQTKMNARRENNRRILNYLKGSGGALSVGTLATSLLLNLGVMNASLASKLTGKDEYPQSKLEDFCTVACDLAACPSCIFGPPCYLGPLLILFGIVAAVSILLS